MIFSRSRVSSLCLVSRSELKMLQLAFLDGRKNNVDDLISWDGDDENPSSAASEVDAAAIACRGSPARLGCDVPFV